MASKPRADRSTPKTFRFEALRPLRHAQTAPFAALNDLVTEAATWFFEDPQFTDGRTVRPELSNPSPSDLLDAVAVGMRLLENEAKDAAPGSQGGAAVDIFCRRHIARAPTYAHPLSSGRTIGQRQLLCALTLAHLELAARAIKAGRSDRVAGHMTDVVELVCEVRRALDREAGSDVASRGARKRAEKYHAVRRFAEQLFDKTPGKNVAVRSEEIFDKIQEFSRTNRTNLTDTRGRKTVYDWLCSYDRNRTRSRAMDGC